MLSIATVAMGAVFTSCNKNDIEPMTEAQIQEAKYTKAFQDAFGQINPNVNWGFDAMTVYSGAVTRGHNVNRNEWGTGSGVGGNVNVPTNVTADERELVFDYFNKVRKNDKSVQVNWSDFFVSQVYGNEGNTVDGSNQPVEDICSHMNQLLVRYGEGSIDANGNTVGDWEHVNDFNKGDHNAHWNDIEGHTYMNNSGTLEFAYHNTTDSKYHNEYLIVAGATIDESLAGYYYVAFDFYATHPIGQEANKNMDVDRDYVYTDWIVRISPAEFKNAQRVMVEDLIANNLSQVDKSDWDFNDAVFDVAYSNDWIAAANANKLVAHITLYAAGGTKELFIGGKEVHQLFGVSTKTMVNTNAANNGVNGLAPVIFTVIMGDADYGTHTADEVPVFVGTTELKAEQGKAPQKIVTDPDTRWMKERQLITLGYASFANYVNGNTPKTWYKTVSEASVLYK